MPTRASLDPERNLELRRKLGLDKFDEEWDGIYHVTPAPTPVHARILVGLLFFLQSVCDRRGGGTLLPDLNVFADATSRRNYRIPDITFLAPGREALVARDGIRGGAPDSVIEIRSPGDETDAKLPFYERLGVREVVIVDRESRVPEVHSLQGGVLKRRAPDAGGWIVSGVFGVRLRLHPEPPPRLEIEDATDPTIRTVL